MIAAFVAVRFNPGTSARRIASRLLITRNPGTAAGSRWHCDAHTEVLARREDSPGRNARLNLFNRRDCQHLSQPYCALMSVGGKPRGQSQLGQPRLEPQQGERGIPSDWPEQLIGARAGGASDVPTGSVLVGSPARRRKRFFRPGAYP
jgi:hypothetical protein